jgi:ribosomal protein S18 acetylase RimI-like enzyme
LGFYIVKKTCSNPALGSIVGVASEFRRQGVGESLMKELKNRYTADHSALCEKVQPGGIQLYEKLGYKIKESRQRYYLTEKTLWLWGKLKSPLVI